MMNCFPPYHIYAMNAYRISLIIISMGLLASCDKNKVHEPMADSGRTLRAEILNDNLKALGDSNVYMFGHHDDTVYGIGWESDYSNDSTVHQRSDVHSVCNDFPAVFSFDLGHIELGDERNLDSVPFSRIRQEIIAHFDRGGLITLSWHLDNPLSGGSAWVADTLIDTETHTVEAVLKGGQCHEMFLEWLDRVADFLNSLETPYGIKVPVLFRPWHEHTGSWFWWGKDHCTAEQYKALWNLTVKHLEKRGVVNALYAYSPNGMKDQTKEVLMERYPGDDLIDLIGYDYYCNAEKGDTTAVAKYADDLDKGLSLICEAAQEHHKAVALTETGFECIKTPAWWTQTLAPVLAKHPISYVLVWRNAHNRQNHFFAPYPGHISSSDFIRFYNDPRTLFLKDVNALYLERKK